MTQKKQITKRTFICNILPSDYIIKSKASQAAINFCNRLVDGKCFNDIRSITPISYQLPPQITYKNITFIIRKSKFPQNPKRSVRFSGKRTKRSVQKRKARNTQKAETKVL